MDNEITLKIGRINFKTETFCTKWNDKMYCVDVFEDAEERSAWLYGANSGIKTLMWGEKIGQQSRDDFLDCVFSNLPDYIDDYEDDMEIYENAMCDWIEDNNPYYTAKAQDMLDYCEFDSAVALMDDKIREAVHADLAPCSDLEFLAEYMKRHARKYGEEFSV